MEHPVSQEPQMPWDDKAKAALAELGFRYATVSPAVAQETEVTSFLLLA